MRLLLVIDFQQIFSVTLNSIHFSSFPLFLFLTHTLVFSFFFLIILFSVHVFFSAYAPAGKSCENWFSRIPFAHERNCNFTRHIFDSRYNATVRRQSDRLRSHEVSGGDSRNGEWKMENRWIVSSLSAVGEALRSDFPFSRIIC